MKKIMFFGGMLLSAMTFVSCSDDFTDWAAPQSNPQEESVTLPGYTASATSAVDLATVTGDSVHILTLSQATLPEGATVGNTRIELLPSDGSATAAATIDVDNEGRVGKTDLQAALESFYGKRPTERVMSGHVYSNIIINGQTFLVDASTINVTATPEAPYIASAYYLVGDVTGGWDADHVVKFSHSGADVYEDPVFTVTFTAAAGNYWKIIPQGNIDSGDFWHAGKDGVLGVLVNDDTAMSGTLVTQNAEGGEPGAGKIENAGMYRMTINMLEYTYTIEEMAVTYYLVGDFGNANAWSTTDKSCVFYPQTTAVQTYTTQWNNNGNFKFWTEVGNWDSAFGAQAEDGSATGKILANNDGAQNIKAPTVGEYYTVTIDMGTMTYTWTRLDNQAPTEYNSIGLIGVGGDWNNDVVMTEVTPHNWYVNTTVAADCDVKFRADASWDIMDWGADVNVADQTYGTGTKGGANIKVPAGTYSIYLNDITGQFVFVAE